MPRANPRPLGRGRASCCLLLVAIALGCATILGIQSLAASRAEAGTPRFATAPDFATTDVEGASRTLSQYLNAKPILLEFMSPDCPHCLEMVPILTRVHTTYGTKVQFLTVAFDKSARRMQQFARLEKHGWPYLMGTQPITDSYRLEGVPTFYFLTPDGRVVAFVEGSMPEENLREHIDRLLKAK